MKQITIILTLLLIALSACQISESIPASCSDVTADDVESWVKAHASESKENHYLPFEGSPQVHWIGKAVYNGETVFYTNRYQEGYLFCGTGLTFDDMFITFTCKGKLIIGIDWDDLENVEEFYNSYPTESNEEGAHGPS